LQKKYFEEESERHKNVFGRKYLPALTNDGIKNENVDVE